MTASHIKKMLLLLLLLVIPCAGCILLWGVDTVRITTDPPGADVYTSEHRVYAPTDLYMLEQIRDYIREQHSDDLSKNTPSTRRSYLGKSPVSIPAQWLFAYFLPGGRALGYSSWTTTVTVEMPGCPPITKRIVIKGQPIGSQPVSKREGSRFGWGETYEYFFQMRTHREIEEARQNELLDTRAVAVLLRELGFRADPITIWQWMKDEQFPAPTKLPRDDRSSYGALWRRGDIESWPPP